MDRTASLQRCLSGMPAPEQIISHGISPMGGRFPARLLISLADMVLRPGGTDAACLAITEAAASGAAVCKTPLIGATRLGAGGTVAAITEAPVIGTALLGPMVTITAILKTPFVVPTVTIAAFEATGRP